jgi:hypothetical protein
VNKELGARGKVVVDDVVQKRDVDATRSHIRHNQDVNTACTEFGTVYPPGSLHFDRGTHHALFVKFGCAGDESIS